MSMGRCIAMIFAVLMLLAWPNMAGAVQPDEVLEDPVMEQRAREISAMLRCMVCQNQSIDDSDADLARDLRILVRERLVEGDDDDEVIGYLVRRYGDFVLLKPRFSLQNGLLWATPFLILVAGGFLSYRLLSRQKEKKSARLSASEDDALRKILQRDE